VSWNRILLLLEGIGRRRAARSSPRSAGRRRGSARRRDGPRARPRRADALATCSPRSRGTTTPASR
jgi:hypothetical protein